ncbi:CBL-interacting protein kinase 2 [Hibiscus syriacus]|uniref:non-specific serine/threonine protein kinase n=1 Tax=Hibiscus syriacus TaxID=106335 RepID=A0A6A3B0Y7_HIBSY|nr:CBL-interacting protein kinase 2 [Hibiscus syriacus]
MHKYEFGKLLGQGNFGKVYYVKHIETRQSVAIKVIEKEKIQKVGMIDQTKKEISSMSLVKHPNILELYEGSGEWELREDIARKYFHQLISAVDFCHRRGIYHRDLKPENLLLDENGTLDVLDFGLSALETDDEKKKKEVHLTSVHGASDITSKLKDTAQQLKFKIKKEDGGLLKIEKSRKGQKGSLVIDAEIFEVTPSFHLVEMKKSSGDSLEFKSMLQEDVRPALKDIVWSWQ